MRRFAVPDSFVEAGPSSASMPLPSTSDRQVIVGGEYQWAH
jgi:hypothetical protein